MASFAIISLNIFNILTIIISFMFHLSKFILLMVNNLTRVGFAIIILTIFILAIIISFIFILTIINFFIIRFAIKYLFIIYFSHINFING